MLTISLHGIRIQAPIGVYAEEKLLSNRFEIDVDVWVEAKADEPWPFVDYTEINALVHQGFQARHDTLEAYVQEVYGRLRDAVFIASKIRVLLRKYHPPMSGEVGYAQVCFEQ